jgi:hypothetical protein
MEVAGANGRWRLPLIEKSQVVSYFLVARGSAFFVRHQSAMRTSRVIQFAVAAVLFSAGCAVLLFHGLFAFSTICFCLPGIVLMRRAEFSRPVQCRESFGILVVLLILVTAVILLKLFVPDSVGERLVRHPAFVVPLWVLMMVGLFWRWRRERRLSDA